MRVRTHEKGRDDDTGFEKHDRTVRVEDTTHQHNTTAPCAASASVLVRLSTIGPVGLCQQTN